MDASESSKRFGPQGQPHDYDTPHTLTAGKKSYILLNLSLRKIWSIDNRFYLKITSHPNNLQTRTASWYQMWEAAILLNAMCIRHGKKGTFKVHSDGAPNVDILESELLLRMNPNIDMDFSWLEVEMGALQASNNLTLPFTTE